MEPRTDPVDLRVAPDGVGSACFSWDHVLDVIRGRFVHHIEHSLTSHAHLLGLRFVDADGRDTSGPVPGGVVLVGFATSPAAPAAGPHHQEEPS